MTTPTERERFIAAMRAVPCPDHWTFEDDGTGGFHNAQTEWAFIGWQAHASEPTGSPEQAAAVLSQEDEVRRVDVLLNAQDAIGWFAAVADEIAKEPAAAIKARVDAINRALPALASKPEQAAVVRSQGEAASVFAQDAVGNTYRLTEVEWAGLDRAMSALERIAERKEVEFGDGYNEGCRVQTIKDAAGSAKYALAAFKPAYASLTKTPQPPAQGGEASDVIKLWREACNKWSSILSGPHAILPDDFDARCTAAHVAEAAADAATRAALASQGAEQSIEPVISENEITEFDGQQTGIRKFLITEFDTQGAEPVAHFLNDAAEGAPPHYAQVAPEFIGTEGVFPLYRHGAEPVVPERARGRDGRVGR